MSAGSARERSLLHRLARASGVQTGYVDAFGCRREPPPETLCAILRALGHDIPSPGQAAEALRRLEQLTAEVSQQPMREVIGEAVDLIVSIERTDRGRQVRDVLHVESFSAGQYQTQSFAPKEERHVA